ncbi:MAG: hypothetical protein AAB215_09875 [Planctomycetota bacterium]
MNSPLTLDLRDNARLSVNFLEKNLDEKQGYLPWFKTHYGEDPVRNRHTHWDFCENPGRYTYGIVCVRQMLAQDVLQETEKRLRDVMKAHFSEHDGLNYRPKVSPFENYVPHETGPNILHEAELWDNRSVYMGLFLTALTTGNPEAKKLAEGMIDALDRIAIWKGNECHFGKIGVPPGYKPSADEPPLFGETMGGWVTPLANTYRLTGDARALRLAEGLSNFAVKNGGPLEGPMEGRFNTHSVMFILAGILRTARITGNRDHVEWCRRRFDWYRWNEGTSFGWYSETPHDAKLKPGEIQSAETCAVADALDAAIQLARAGLPRYWNEAERIARNYLVEAQLKDVSWMKATKKGVENATFSTDRIPERLIGCYAGWGAVNDFVNPKARASGLNSIMHCCGPQGALGVFLAWHHGLLRDEKGVRVNLLLSRAASFARVDSYLPHEGRVDVRMDVCDRLAVRVPDWVDPRNVRAESGGKPVDVRMEGFDFADLGFHPRGAIVTVRFPVAKIRRKEAVEGTIYTTDWRGDTVVSIDPPGTVNPFFARKSLDNDRAPMGERDYAYPANEIDW